MLVVRAIAFCLILLSVCGLGYFAIYRVEFILRVLRRRSMVAYPSENLITIRDKVCIQCPCYNEPFVIEPLLDAVSQIRWHGEIEVQILDDSDDATSEIVATWLQRNPMRSMVFRHIRRSVRDGYKAGALNAGLALTDAPFIALFDADFRPEPDFLERLMPYFVRPQVGVVQARWDYCNRDTSLLTQFQASILDVHFAIEQPARHGAGLFFNFNGTAGIWRREALVDGGGWSADTVTEDLDLSYKTQLRGWCFVYAADYGVQSELPETITAFKSQQRRWTKGGVQVARRQLGRVLQSSLPWPVKFEALRHLTIGAFYPLLACFALTLSPFLALADPRTDMLARWIAVIVGVELLALTASFVFAGLLGSDGVKVQRFPSILLRAPGVLLFLIGMSLLFTFSFCEGAFATSSGEFVRTPKGRHRIRDRQFVALMSGRRLLVCVAWAEVGLGVVGVAAAYLFGRYQLPIAEYAAAVIAFPFLILGFISARDLKLICMPMWMSDGMPTRLPNPLDP